MVQQVWGIVESVGKCRCYESYIAHRIALAVGVEAPVGFHDVETVEVHLGVGALDALQSRDVDMSNVWHRLKERSTMKPK